MLEVLMTLLSDEDAEIRRSTAATIEGLDWNSFEPIAANTEISPDVLGFICLWPSAPRAVVEAAVFNRSLPDNALVQLASKITDGGLIEAISQKQQSLIRTPQIIEAILANPARTPDAERRAVEVRQEFFEKAFGAGLVADEERARQQAREQAEEASETITVGGFDDLVRLGLLEPDVDDSIVQEYESEYGPFDSTPSRAQEVMDVEQIVSDVLADDIQVEPERIPIFQQIAHMSTKDRVMLAIKGTRDARVILVRDPNRIVACAVLRNPKLTDPEVESIAAIKTAPEDVLRQIGQNRAWTKSYNVIHNLVRNARTPISISLAVLPRILTRDLRVLSTNKNVPDVIRTSASRLYIKRSTGT